MISKVSYIESHGGAMVPGRTRGCCNVDKGALLADGEENACYFFWVYIG